MPHSPSSPRAAKSRPGPHRGQLFILSAPSGAGKTTLIQHLLASDVPDLGFSVSHTTRAPRPGEVEGEHYHFVDRATFQQMIQAGDFLEWARVHGNFYGTSRQAVERQLARGRDVLLDIDVQGAEQVRQRWPEACTIFILPPSYADLEQRLRGRGADDPQVIAHRLAEAVREIRRFDEYDHVILNREVGDAVRALSAIILARRSRLERMYEQVQQVLREFPAPPSPDL